MVNCVHRHLVYTELPAAHISWTVKQDMMGHSASAKLLDRIAAIRAPATIIGPRVVIHAQEAKLKTATQ